MHIYALIPYTSKDSHLNIFIDSHISTCRSYYFYLSLNNALVRVIECVVSRLYANTNHVLYPNTKTLSGCFSPCVCVGTVICQHQSCPVP